MHTHFLIHVTLYVRMITNLMGRENTLTHIYISTLHSNLMFTQTNPFTNLIIITNHPFLLPKIHLHLTQMILMKNMLNLKITILISSPTPYILFHLPMHHPKHPPLMEHPFLPYLHILPLMITLTHIVSTTKNITTTIDHLHQ